MKNVLKNIWILTFVIVLITGCTSPKSAYQKEVKDVGIEKSLEDIKASAIAVDLSYNTFFDHVELSATDLSDFAEFDACTKGFNDYMALVESTNLQVNKWQDSEVEVQAINDQLIKVLSSYEEIGRQMKGIITLATGLFDVLVKLNTSNEQLNTLENPSEEYSAAVYSFMLENANIVDKLSSFDYNTLLASEQLDLSNLQDVKTNVSTLLEGLAQMPISTEVDKTYNDLMISMYTSMVVMMDIFIENIESLKFIAAYQSDEESFIQLGLKETDVTIQEWKDAMKK